MNTQRSQNSLIMIFLLACLDFSCNSQPKIISTEKDHLTLISKIDMPEVKSRIDHIAYDPTNHIAFIAALGNNSIEVINLDTKQIVQTIKGLDEPQGIVYIPALKRIVIANGGNGDCMFFDALTYKQLGAVHLKGDADNVRYDETSQLIYVGYGDGGIAIIDANSMKQVGDISLDGHPESFQLSKKMNRIFINVPDANEIEVAYLSTNKVISKWKNTVAASNFPMTINEDKNWIIVACRNPSKIRMIDTDTGKDVFSANCSGDADDVFFNSTDSLVFVSAGEGFIDVFRVREKELLQINQIRTRNGARTSILLNAEKRFLLAVPAHGGEPASLWIYSVN